MLTKALGVGVATTAIKRGAASDELMAAAVASMTASNAKAAASAAVAAGATGATDVTGFGLLGHLAKMAAASGVDAEVDVAAVPFPAGVRALVEAGIVPGGSRRNLDWVAPSSTTAATSEVDALLLADAQTSGGLLFGAAPERAAAAVAELGPPAAVIGRVRVGSGGSSCGESDVLGVGSPESALGGVAEADGNRTRLAELLDHVGFEDRGGHQAPSRLPARNPTQRPTHRRGRSRRPAAPPWPAGAATTSAAATGSTGMTARPNPAEPLLGQGGGGDVDAAHDQPPARHGRKRRRGRSRRPRGAR